MDKLASLLDYSYPGLDITVWDKDGKLLAVHKDFVVNTIDSFCEKYGLKQQGEWITDIVIIGSLTTYKYLRNSDVDIHILVDAAKFKETNKPELSDKEALEHLDNLRKAFDEEELYLPLNLHPLEIYFEDPKLNPSNTSLVGIYSIFSDEWLRAPVPFPQDTDYEEIRQKAVEEASDLAGELDASFGKIRRTVQRVEELAEIIKAWPKEQRQYYYNKLQEKLDLIEEEVKKAIEVKDDLVDERHKKQDPLSDNEVVFKYLQRFSYFYTISALKDLLKEDQGITTENIEEVKEIVQHKASLVQAEHEKVLAIDFDGTIAEDKPDHTIGEPMAGVKEALEQLQAQGYKVEIYSHRATENGSDEVREWLDKNEIPYDSILEVDKPLAFKYIDDRALQFTTWNSILEQLL